MTNTKAIEQRYNGFHFRSRIEARWAIFFDVAGIRYEYEPEKFQVSTGRYIPDFWLPDMGPASTETLKPDGVFFEVKGADPTEAELRKAADLAQSLKREVWVFFGSAFDRGCCITPWRLDLDIHSLNQCPMCGGIGLSWEPTGDDEYSTHHHWCVEGPEIARKYDVFDYFAHEVKVSRHSPLLDLASEAAKSARFEDANYMEQIKGLILAGQRLRDQRIFCSPDITAAIISTAVEWKAGGGSPYRAPWWVTHRADLLAGKTPCSCYRCVADAGRAGGAM